MFIHISYKTDSVIYTKGLYSWGMSSCNIKKVLQHLQLIVKWFSKKKYLYIKCFIHTCTRREKRKKINVAKYEQLSIYVKGT